MRVTIKFYLALTLFFLSFLSFSQTGSNQISEQRNIKLFNLQSSNLIGTSYINVNFLPAKIMDSDEIYSMRYNAYEDVLEVGINGEHYYSPKKFNYPITFVESNKTYQVFSHRGRNNFFVVLNSGKNIYLLLREKINFYDEQKSKGELQKYKPPTLKREADSFFIGYKNNKATKLPRKKKNFLKLFSSKSKDVETYLKRNKLGFKKKEDLIKIFVYYSTL